MFFLSLSVLWFGKTSYVSYPDEETLVKTALSRLSLIGSDVSSCDGRHVYLFIRRAASCREPSIPRSFSLHRRRQKWSLTVSFACYININYSSELSADKHATTTEPVFICHKRSFTFAFFFFFFLSLFFLFLLHVLHSEIRTNIYRNHHNPCFPLFSLCPAQVCKEVSSDFWTKTLVKFSRLLPIKHFKQFQVFRVSLSYSELFGNRLILFVYNSAVSSLML